MNHPQKYRPLVLGLATVLVMLAVGWAATSTPGDPKDEPVAFFLIGDTHLVVDKKDPDKLDERSAMLTRGLVDTLNKLAGTEIPKAAGGGTVLRPRGVIHAGDCIETGDAAKVKMQQTEWNAFTAEFGLTGKDGRLKLPIYEVHGNHDGTRDKGIPITQIIERNKTRPLVNNLSKNGLHYSWDWGNVHFVNLGIVVGQADAVKRKRRYDPLGSLEFLVADLKDKVGDSGRPVVLTHHVDMLRYAQSLPVEDKKAEGMEWDPADVKAFHEALNGYNVAAILYGHTHGRNVFRWDGSAKAAKTGIPVFNVTKSSHFSSMTQGFFYIEIRGDTVTAREFQTRDGWQTGAWTPQVWTVSVK
jgi:cytolysin (calcineurin-like family phosphatase)